MPSASLIKEFEQLVGKENVFSSEADRQSYAYDAAVLKPMIPSLVVRPTEVEQLGQVVKRCYEEGIPMTVRGSGTNLTGGTIPDCSDTIVILTTGLNKILEINTEDLYATVQPGVITAKFAAAVAAKGLFYPPDPGSMSVSTIGGNVAESSGGLRGLKYGTTKDYVMGMEVFANTGDLVKTGSRTVKCATGYNIAPLLVGSEGTLAVTSKVTLKLIPPPKASKAMMALFKDMDGASQAVAGIIAAHVVPCTLEFLDHAVLNFISIPGLVGPVVGPLLGGWLVTYATWHWIFLINIPIGLIGILYAYHIMPDFTAPRRPFDWMGFFLFGLSLVSFSSGLEVFGDRVGPDFLPPVLLISGIALLGLYIRHARRHPSPLIRLSVFRMRTFSVGIGGNILSRLGTGCVPFLMPLMLQVGLGYPALVAGAMMAPTAIGSITAKTFAMKILNRFGYRVTLTGVTVCIGLMIAQFALQTPTLPLWMLILPLFMLGMAMSTQFTAMNSITLGDLSTEDASTGNGLLSVTQQLSISFGVASSTVVLRFYNSFASGTLLDHFHYTFITIGGITMMAAFVFMLLRKDDGDSLLPGRKKPVFETTSSSTPRNP